MSAVGAPLAWQLRLSETQSSTFSGTQLLLSSGRLFISRRRPASGAITRPL